MNKKELDIELDKIYENQKGDEIYIPNCLIAEVFDRMLKKYSE